MGYKTVNYNPTLKEIIAKAAGKLETPCLPSKKVYTAEDACRAMAILDRLIKSPEVASIRPIVKQYNS
jgi:hypothetical protein